MLTPAELSARVRDLNRDMRQLFSLSGGAWVAIFTVSLI